MHGLTVNPGIKGCRLPALPPANRRPNLNVSTKRSSNSLRLFGNRDRLNWCDWLSMPNSPTTTELHAVPRLPIFFFFSHPWLGCVITQHMASITSTNTMALILRDIKLRPNSSHGLENEHCLIFPSSMDKRDLRKFFLVQHQLWMYHNFTSIDINSNKIVKQALIPQQICADNTSYMPMPAQNDRHSVHSFDPLNPPRQRPRSAYRLGERQFRTGMGTC